MFLGRVRDRIMKIGPGISGLIYRGGSIELIKIKTHFRKKLEVGNSWPGVRALEKPVFFGGWDSNFGNSILNNFLPENWSWGQLIFLKVFYPHLGRSDLDRTETTLLCTH